MRARAPKLKAVQLDPGNELAVRLWNVMEGINWTALSLLVEYHGVRDAEQLVDALLVIQDYQRQRAAQE